MRISGFLSDCSNISHFVSFSADTGKPVLSNSFSISTKNEEVLG
jgi:hypothetical protein